MPGINYLTSETLERKASEWKKSIESFSENVLAKLDSPALLIIDMQRYFADPKGRAYLPATAAVMNNINSLIDSFRRHERPVIFTRHGHARNADAGLMHSWWKGRLLYEDEPDAELTEGLNFEPNDMVIRKQHYDAFRNTELDSLLRDHNIQTLVICGVMTDLCVETTARQSFLNGFQPAVVLDAAASKNEELHLAALKTLSHGFAYVERTKRIVELMK